MSSDRKLAGVRLQPAFFPGLRFRKRGFKTRFQNTCPDLVDPEFRSCSQVNGGLVSPESVTRVTEPKVKRPSETEKPYK